MRRLLWLAIPMGCIFIGVAIFLAFPRTCYGCSVQAQPPECGVNLSAMTLHRGDTRQAWWNFLAPREDRTLHLYLGLNNNQGNIPVDYTYQVNYNGDWDPAIAGQVTPITGTGQLGPAGTRNANNTIEITVPYSTTQTGDLNVTTNVQSTNGACVFHSPASTIVRLNDAGPTVWPITPRTCPNAGTRPQINFGLRNPSDTAETYDVVARAYNPFGGSNSDQFNLNGQGAEAQLPPVEVKPGETKQIKVDCETFGYCVTGGENRVELRVRPRSGGGKQASIANAQPSFDAFAWSNVTIRDPNASCPEPRDWWFLMPPLLLALLIGVPAALAAMGGGAAYLRSRSIPPSLPPPPSPPPPIESTSQPGGGLRPHPDTGQTSGKGGVRPPDDTDG